MYQNKAIGFGKDHVEPRRGIYLKGMVIGSMCHHASLQITPPPTLDPYKLWFFLGREQRLMMKPHREATVGAPLD